jgi:non-specific serine/threonine protein kinase
LDLAQTMGNRRREAFIISAVATLAGAAGHAERAVRLDAAAFAAIAALGAVLAKPMHATCAPFVGRSSMVLGEAQAEAAAAAGRALTLARAVEEARIWLAETPFSDAVRPSRRETLPPAQEPRVLRAAPARSSVLGLSPRELEVAALVARGMTNRQIAEALVITEGTAANHVKHILARLVLDSRVQIAAWAVERGLHRASSA